MKLKCSWELRMKGRKEWKGWALGALQAEGGVPQRPGPPELGSIRKPKRLRKAPCRRRGDEEPQAGACGSGGRATTQNLLVVTGEPGHPSQPSASIWPRGLAAPPWLQWLA